jgi:hypothetical protein
VGGILIAVGMGGFVVGILLLRSAVRASAASIVGVAKVL